MTYGSGDVNRSISAGGHRIMGGAFGEICREHARRFSQEYFTAPAQEIGRIWQADYDIDVAGRLLDSHSTGSRLAYTSNNAAGTENTDTFGETSGALAALMYASGAFAIECFHNVHGARLSTSS
jgi:hypothetical protein